KSSRVEAFQRYFIYSVGALLLFTGTVKLLALVEGGEPLKQIDPVFSIRRDYLVFGVAVLELGLVPILLWASNELRLGLILWLSCCFGIYKLGLAWSATDTTCPCLLQTRWLYLNSKSLQWFANGILVYMFSGSTYFSCIRSHFRANPLEKPSLDRKQ